jgi:hypothetical protein
MSILLWIVQIVLTVFCFAGVKVFRYEQLEPDGFQGTYETLR